MSPASPRISVIVPLYNMGEYLPECLESLSGQLDGEIEVLIVDDCSTDDSAAVAEREIDLHPELAIRLIRQPQNGGVSRARNRGLDEAVGEFVTFLDPDDLLAEGALRSMLRLADRDRADLVVANYETFKEVDGEYVFGRYAGVHQEGVFAYELAGRLWSVPRVVYAPAVWSKLIRRAAIEGEGRQLRFPVGVKVGEDHIFSVATYVSVDRIAVLPRVAYRYRRGVTHSATAGRFTLERFRCLHLVALTNLPLLSGWPRYFYSRRFVDYEIVQNVSRIGDMPLREAKEAFTLLREALHVLDPLACEEWVSERDWARKDFEELAAGRFARCYARHSLRSSLASVAEMSRRLRGE